MMKQQTTRLLLCLSCCIMILVSQAQPPKESTLSTRLTNPIVRSLENLEMTTEKDIVGSPFLQEEWIPSKVYSIEKKIILADMKYDVFHDEMNVNLSDGVFILDDRFIRIVILGERFFRRYPISKAKTTATELAYFEILQEGEISFLKRHTTKVVRGYKGTGYEEETKTKLSLKEYLFYHQQGELIPIKLRKGKRNVLRILKSKKLELKAFAKKNKLSFTREADLIQIFEFYNSFFELPKNI